MACGLDEGSVTAKWIQDAHLQRCDTSCNDCLREFYNLPYHGLLDWRLALDMARLAQDSSTHLDPTSEPVDGLPGHWRSLVNRPETSLCRSLQQFGFRREETGDAACFVSSHHRKVLVPSHPLWNGDHPVLKELSAHMELAHPGYSIQPLDLFLGVRRPADFL
jgi:hypothetical protein